MVFHAEDGRQETADIVSDGLSVTTEQDQGEPDLDRQLATSDVHFKCPNLEAAIRKVLKKTDGTIPRNDLASLTEISADHDEIADLTGLDYATNLTKLGLAINQFTDDQKRLLKRALPNCKIKF